MFKLFSLAAASVLLASATSAQVPLDTVRIANGLSSPIGLAHVPGDASRLFVIEQGSGGTARIKILNIPGNTVNATPFLTLTGLSTGGERGLLGLAFHPNYATNGFFYVYVSTSATQNAVRRYSVTANPDIADPASIQNVLLMADPFSNHNGGWISFGPDGFLYVSTGDGGSSNDPQNNGQTTSSLLGKMLRLDVNSDAFPGDANKNYAIPPTNPFATTGGAPEVFHYGLRNAWRNDFDNLTGDLYIADVGQGAWEEVDFSPAGVGGINYGWRCREGAHCTSGVSCTNCSSPSYTDPIAEYSHSLGCSITGGVVYRGTQLCGWEGTYWFADVCTARIWSLKYTGTVPSPITLRTTELAPGGGLSIDSITSFGEDALGEMYIVDQGGEIFKVIRAPGGPDCNANGTPDSCDIASGTSLDANSNGVPDECEPSVVAYCFGDGSGTPCPCGNAGAAGNGCANSVNGAGANFAASGTASVSSDSLILVGTGMPNSSALFFQGTTQTNGGLGNPFGDGLRCVSGTVIRLSTQTNVGGTSQYPGIFDLPISVKGGITGGPQTRYYQQWYRNPAPGFCTPDVYNFTNGLKVVWVN